MISFPLVIAFCMFSCMFWVVSICFCQGLICYSLTKYGNSVNSESNLFIKPLFSSILYALSNHTSWHTLFGRYPSIYGNFWSTGPNPMIWGDSGSSFGVLSVCRYVISTIYVILCKMCGIQRWIRGKRSYVHSCTCSWVICKILMESQQ